MDPLQNQLSDIANYAYGSRFFERTHGGMGNIGLIEGRVVKFNTQRADRGGPVTDEMRRSCNDLRWRIESLAIGLLRDAGVSLQDFKKEIAAIRAKLGLSLDGQTVVSTKLLDRKVVAAVIKRIDARTGVDSFSGASAAVLNLRGESAKFGTNISPEEGNRQEGTHEMREGVLSGRINALFMELSAIKENAGKNLSGTTGTVRLQRLEIDLHVAKEGLDQALAKAVEFGDEANQTRLMSLAEKLKQMQSTISGIRGEAVAKLGVQLVQDHCPQYGKDDPVTKFFKPENIKPIVIAMANAGIIGDDYREGPVAGRFAQRICTTVNEKIPAALKGISDAVKAYLGAKDAKSAAAALKNLKSQASGLKKLEFGYAETALFNGLARGVFGAGKKPFAELLANLQAAKLEVGMDLYTEYVDVVGQPSPFALLVKAGEPDNVDRLVNRIKTFRDYTQTNFGTYVVDDRLLAGMLNGEYDVGTFVGARAWQATPDMIDPSIQDANRVESRPLGSGSVNSTTLCTYRMPDGTERSYVFKPEQVGRNSTDNMLLMHYNDYRSDQQLAHLNFASAKAAEELGLAGKVPGIRVGTSDGSFGMFMDCAPGVSAEDLIYSKENEHVARRNEFRKFLGVDETGELPPGEALNRENIGKIAHATTDLEWLDAIIGNGDRHGGNYHIDVSGEGNVKVTGIDNDTTFPPWHLGFGKYRLDPERIKDRYGKPIEALKRDFESRFRWDGANQVFSGNNKDGWTVDIYKIKDDHKKARVWLAQTLEKCYGFQRVARPNFISTTVYEKLRQICCKPDGTAVSDFDLTDYVMTTYGPHLKDTDQVDAMVSRLKNAWEHAQELAAKKRLIEDDAWGGEDCFGKLKADWHEEKLYDVTQQDFFMDEFEEQYAFRSLMNRDVFDLMQDLRPTH